MQHIDDILTNIGVDPNAIAISYYRGRQAYSYRELVHSVLSRSEINVSRPTVRKAFNKVIDISDKGTRPWSNYLLDKYSDYKHCNRCNTTKLKSEFNLDNESFDKLSSICRECKKKLNNDWHRENYETIRKSYVDNNRSSYNERSARRKAQKLKATPKWANLFKIKEIYNNCPDGYHVDHIIPLQGKNVCGLHVENNLQYLTAFENMSKGNNFG